MRIQQIGVAVQLLRDVPGNLVVLFQVVYEGLDMGGQPVPVFPAQPDVQITALAKYPAITLQVRR